MFGTYLSLNVFLLILVVVGLHAELQFFDELLLRVLVYTKSVKAIVSNELSK